MDDLIGTWKLITFQEHQPDGELLFPYGKDPVGLLVYGAEGQMCVQIMRKDRPLLSSDNWLEVEARELKAALQGFTAFFGTYTVNEEENAVVHHVVGHIIPNSVGKDLLRRFELNGNRRTLAPTEHRSIVWERVG